MNLIITKEGSMRILRIFSFVILPLIVLSHTSYAQEIVTDNDFVAGARAMGMGGAQIAASQDITAVIHNPAALARLRNIEAQLGFVLLQREVKTNLKSNFVNGYGSTIDNYTGLGTFGVAYPVPTVRGSLVFALAYNRVKDFSGIFKLDDYNDYAFEQDGDTWPGNEKNEITEAGGLGVFSFAGAVDVSPNVSLGASVDIWTGSYSIDNRLLRNDSPGEVSWLDITGGEDNITALSFKPSILYFNDNFRFGAFVRFPMTFHIEQKNYEEYYSRNDGYFFNIHSNIDPYSGADYFDDSDYYRASYKIKAPIQLGLGFSLGEPGKHCIALDVVYENWEEAEFGDEYDPYYFREKYRTVLNWRMGIEQNIPFLKTVGRIGYLRQPETFKGPRGDIIEEPTIDVLNERDFLTFGFSKNFDESFRLDVGYAHGFRSIKEGAREDKETRDKLYLTINYSLPNNF